MVIYNNKFNTPQVSSVPFHIPPGTHALIDPPTSWYPGEQVAMVPT